MTTLSVLDLAPVPQGSSPAEALSNTLKLARAAEGFGYHRYWVAEHHNMKGIASAATAVVIGYIANGTSKIRVGSGGIMLPNHAPLVVAAQLAAALGLPYAFASHYAPQDMMQAIAIYRERFKPSEQLQKPHVMLGYNVFVADTDEEALYLRSSALQSMLSLRRGNPIQLPPPVEGLEASLSAPEAAMLEMITRCSAVGSVQSAANQMGEFLMRTGADELMCVSSIYDHDKRVRSIGLALEARDLLSQKAA